jgi:hypothetical protein
MNELAAIRYGGPLRRFVVLLLAIVQERRLLFLSALVYRSSGRQGNALQFDAAQSVSPSGMAYLPAIAQRSL